MRGELIPGGQALMARYLIGIDLGTTNSAVAYIDLQASKGSTPKIKPFPMCDEFTQRCIDNLPPPPNGYVQYPHMGGEKLVQPPPQC